MIIGKRKDIFVNEVIFNIYKIIKVKEVNKNNVKIK